MQECLIAIGSNLGNSRLLIGQAVELISRLEATTLRAVSELVATPPVGGPVGAFLNGAVRIDTDLPCEQLMSQLVRIENQLGRNRHWDANNRTIDLDLLLCGQRIVNTPNLIIPHPRMSFRRFMLVPAAEVAAEMLHPIIGLTIQQLLGHLNEKPNWIGICPATSANSLAAGLSELAALDAHRDIQIELRSAAGPTNLPEDSSEMDRSTWRIFVSPTTDGLIPLFSHLKLIMEFSDQDPIAAENSALFADDGYRGPYWSMQSMQPKNLFCQICTAIDAMLPL